MRNLTLKGKIIFFKLLAISKIVFQSLITLVPRHIVNELEKIQKAFLWKNSSPKIKYGTLCNDYEGGGLISIDISNKIISLQYSWIKRLYDNSFNEWKLSFEFYSNLFFKRNKIKLFLSCYKEIFLYWKKYVTRKLEIPSCILSQYLLCNNNIQI